MRLHAESFPGLDDRLEHRACCPRGSRSGARSFAAGSRSRRCAPLAVGASGAAAATRSARATRSRLSRICGCSSAGKASMMRSMVLAALLVCRVPKTSMPISAAVIARADGLSIAHLADQNDVGVLADGGAKRRAETAGCAARPRGGRRRDCWFGVNELDRILDGDDVLRVLLVDAVDDGGQRRRLARARWGRSRARAPGRDRRALSMAGEAAVPRVARSSRE